VDRSRVGIIIPALNEERTIAAVITNVTAAGVPIVIDDGSTDATSATAKSAGADVVRHDTNQGYDAALNSGFRRAAQLGLHYVVTMDADGQHDPTIVNSFLSALDQGADVVIGIRDRRQRFAESVFASMASQRWGIRDPLCGMKGYRLSLWRELGHFDSYRSIGTELALSAAARGQCIDQRPVQTLPRLDAPRFGSILSANLRIFRAMLIGMFLMPRKWRAVETLEPQ
jgi:glycosyltransferase involved in cell wall biosynthesis